jgi:protein-tyrosine phosphatase
VGTMVSETTSRLISRITDRIYIGSYSGAQLLEYRNEYGITHILNCTPEAHEGLTEFKINQICVNDGSDMTTEQVWFGIKSIEHAIHSGGRILVHCQAGISRSPSFVCGYLMYQGFSWEEALDLVRWQRPQVFPHFKIERSIKKALGQVLDEKTTLLGGSNDK